MPHPNSSRSEIYEALAKAHKADPRNNLEGLATSDQTNPSGFAAELRELAREVRALREAILPPPSPLILGAQALLEYRRIVGA